MRADCSVGGCVDDGTLPTLARLQEVSPREVWPHEAAHFTLWLLANADVLGDLLGMDLELEVAEHAVGDVRLDLLGRDLATGHVVIVENQLDVSDHLHLGQILTYAGGTDPATIVWVTTGFRPEHRSTLDWLNARTDDATRFFGVEVRVVRIGGSQPAPAFRLVAQPNDWEKSVRAAANQAPLSGEGALYRAFWQTWLDRLQHERPGWSRATRPPVDQWSPRRRAPRPPPTTRRSRVRGLSSELLFEDRDPASTRPASRPCTHSGTSSPARTGARSSSSRCRGGSPPASRSTCRGRTWLPRTRGTSTWTGCSTGRPACAERWRQWVEYPCAVAHRSGALTASRRPRPGSPGGDPQTSSPSR